MSNSVPTKGKLIVLSASSGTGKTTIARKLLEEDKNIVQSISCTTRLPRLGEENGIDYHFIGETEFKQRIRKKEFLEWANVFGQYYGTPKKRVLELIKKGRDVLLVIDVQGAKQVKKTMPQAIYVFLAPPSMESLQKRLNQRGTEPKKEIEKRLRIATNELKELNEIFLFDYRIVNKDLPSALKILKTIIHAERTQE